MSLRNYLTTFELTNERERKLFREGHSILNVASVILALGVVYALATGKVKIRYPVEGQDRIGHIDFVKVSNDKTSTNQGFFSYLLHAPQCNFSTGGAALYEGMDLTFPASCSEEISLEGRITAHLSGCEVSKFNGNGYLALRTVIYKSGKDTPKTQVKISCDR